MKIELTETDMSQIADIVTENIKKGIMQSAADSAHYEAMVEKGKQKALRLYDNLAANNGVWEVIEKKISDICREDLRYVIHSELEKIIGDNKKLQKLLFEVLLEGVIDKAKELAYKVNYNDEY